MRRLHKRGKWAAAWAAVSFAFLVGQAGFSLPSPCPGAGSRQEVEKGVAEMGLQEAPAQPEQQAAKRRSPVLYIIFGAVVFSGITYLLLQAAVRERYDITGEWKLKWKYSTDPSYRGPYTLRFTGNRDEGSVTFGSSPNPNGFYSVNTTTKDKAKTVNVNMTVISIWFFSGKFEKRDRLSGTHQYKTTAGDWVAVRGSEEFD